METRKIWTLRLIVTGLGGILGTLVAFGIIPTSEDPRVRIALGVGLGMAVGWVFADNAFHPIVALAALLFLPTGVAGVRDVTMSGFFHPLIALFLAGLIVVEVIKTNGGELVVQYFLERFKLGSRGTFFLLVGTTATLSTCLSNTATTAFMLPIVIGAMKVFNNPIVDRRTRVGVAWAATLGGLATIIGTAPNALAVEALRKIGITVTFMEWFTICLPIAIVSIVVMTILLLRKSFPTIKTSSFAYHLSWNDIRPYVGRLVISVLLFAGLVIVWTVLERKEWKEWQSSFWIGTIVFIAVALFPFRGRALLDGKKLVARDFLKECSILLLFGGGLALGKGIQVAGGDKWLAAAVLPVIAWLPPLLRLPTLGVTVTFTGELLSNTAMAALFLPVLVTGAPDLGIDPKVMGIAMGLCCSHGYTLLIATPPNGIMASGLDKEGHEEYRMTMLTHGPVLNVILVTVAVTMVWWLVR